MNDDQLKIKIDEYLESKYSSVSMQKLMHAYVREAYLRTKLSPKTVQLFSFKISAMDLLCYLQLFEWQNLTTIKLVNVGLTDQQLSLLLEFLQNKQVQGLVLTGNRLTDQAVPLFLNRQLSIRQLYLGRNRISKYRMRENITELRNRYVLYL